MKTKLSSGEIFKLDLQDWRSDVDDERNKSRKKLGLKEMNFQFPIVPTES